MRSLPSRYPPLVLADDLAVAVVVEAKVMLWLLAARTRLPPGRIGKRFPEPLSLLRARVWIKRPNTLQFELGSPQRGLAVKAV